MLSQFLLLWCLLSKFLPFMFPQSTFTFLLSTSLVSEFLHQLSVAGDGQAEEPAEEIEAEVEVGAVVKVKVPGAEVEEASKEAGQTTVHLDLPVEAVSLVAESGHLAQEKALQAHGQQMPTKMAVFRRQVRHQLQSTTLFLE
jgi:hypothetical protein